MEQMANFDIRHYAVRSESVKAANRERNKATYGHYKWIVRSPGNNLLDFYDRQNDLLGKDNRAYSAIPPSLVYHYRFEHEYPNELFDKSKNYGRNAYLRDSLRKYHNTSDPTYWGQVYKSRYDWLVNSPSEDYTFETKAEAFSFLKEKTGQKSVRNLTAVHKVTGKLQKEVLEQMFWRGNAKGWSIIAEKVNETT